MSKKELIEQKINAVKQAHKELRDVIKQMTDEEIAEFKDKLKDIKEDLDDTLNDIKEFREGFIAKYGLNLWRFLVTLGIMAILALIF
nr:MAG TPA: Prominin [Caudoviricetes sp.]